MQKKLTEERDAAYLGAAFVNFDKPIATPVWGTVNPRPLKDKYVNALAARIASEGLGNMKLEYAMVAIVDEEILDSASLCNTNAGPFKEARLSRITLDGAKNIVMCAGQHRFAYLKEKHCASLYSQKGKLEVKKDKISTTSHEIAEIWEEISKLEEEIAQQCVWLVKFYSSRK
jgi:hypothetical protein